MFLIFLKISRWVRVRLGSGGELPNKAAHLEFGEPLLRPLHSLFGLGLVLLEVGGVFLGRGE